MYMKVTVTAKTIHPLSNSQSFTVPVINLSIWYHYTQLIIQLQTVMERMNISKCLC